MEQSFKTSDNSYKFNLGCCIILENGDVDVVGYCDVENGDVGVKCCIDFHLLL
jgi:hypothetical protein